jgi:hypothetical protein
MLFELLLDHGLSLSGCAEPFGVEKLSAERAVEALTTSVRHKTPHWKYFLTVLTEGVPG